MTERGRELLYCPHCGKTLLRVESKQHSERPENVPQWTANVLCLHCFAEICNHGFDWTEEEAISAAVKAWNRRADHSLPEI